MQQHKRHYLQQIQIRRQQHRQELDGGNVAEVPKESRKLSQNKPI